MRRSLPLAAAFLAGIAVGLVLSGPAKPRREPADESPAPAGVRIVAEPAAVNEGGPQPVNTAYRFEDLGHVYYVTVAGKAVTVSRMK